MWGRRKLLLAAIIFSAGFYEFKVTAKRQRLGVAEDAVDDLYDGCREEAMEKFIHSGLLKQELAQNDIFQEAWNRSAKCSEGISTGEKNHNIALSAYANDDHFIETFNADVKTMAKNVSVYENNFHFKSFHFLLMDALTQLKSSDCKNVYLTTDKDYTVENGSKVSFGTFNTVYLSLSASLEFDLHDMLVFNINSCYVANLEDYGCNKEKDKALLSPAEVFTVEGINEKQYDDADYTEVVLKHSHMNRVHNCQIFSRSPADNATVWLVLLLVASSLFLFNY